MMIMRLPLLLSLLMLAGMPGIAHPSMAKEDTRRMLGKNDECGVFRLFTSLSEIITFKKIMEETT